MSEQQTVECPDCGESMPEHWLYWHPFNCDAEIPQEASDA